MNADEIELRLKQDGCVFLSQYKIETSTHEVRHYLQNQGFAINKLEDAGFIQCVSVENNILPLTNYAANSYIAADLAGFIRQRLIETGVSFTFETVLSHDSKLDVLKHAKSKGFRIYLYFVATDDPEINVSRVKIRVAQNGHAVREDIIISRYWKSLNLLYPTIKLSNRAFLFDNSGAQSIFFSEITDGVDSEIFVDETILPEWFKTFVIDKSHNN